MVTKGYFAGALVRRQMRHWLEGMKLAGWPVTWVESKGFLESSFAVNGNAAVHAKLDELIQSIA